MSDDAFPYTSVRSAILNEGLETVGEQGGCVGVFGYTQLRKIVFPSTLQLLGHRAFCMSDRLRCVEFRKGSRLGAMGQYIFYDCDNLRTISLPEGLWYIDSGCFSTSGIKEIIIPNSVEVIESNAFYYCHALRRVVFKEDSTLKKIG